MLRAGRSLDADVLDLLERDGSNIETAALVLRDLIADWPERSHLYGELVELEHEGDRITHDLIHLLSVGNDRSSMDPADGLALAKTLDDIVDHAEETGDHLGMYNIDAPMAQASLLADVLVEAAEQIAGALGCLRTETDLGPYLVEIHRLENEGDRLAREAIASLFAIGIDPMVVIRWKDIFESLEAAVDACEAVANVLEGITLKQRRR
jgi:uncharacterized protein Yka (UPF0111/DUF47 family)